MRRVTLLLAVVGFLGFPGGAIAHPLPNLRYDRTIAIRLDPDGVTIRYALELSEWTMVLDGKNLLSPEETKQIVGSRDFARQYAKKKTPLLIDDIRLTLEGEPVALKPTAIEVVPEHDHLSFRFTFRGEWVPRVGEKHTFAFEDQNFEDRAGTVTLTLDDPAPGLTFLHTEAPSTELRAKSTFELKPEEVRQLRQARVTFEALKLPANPGSSSKSKDSPTPDVTLLGEKPPLWEDLSERGLAALFDSGYGLGVMLLLAFAFGAAHAFTPGHGKTLVAAYLVGERGTVRHACILGLTTTITHTGSVILVAVVLRAVYGDQVPAATAAILKLLGGLLIFAVGLWLFLQRARGRADHVHLFGDHHHHHGDGHHHHHGEAEPGNPEQKHSILRVILLGIGGGLVPCWDAVLLLLVAVTAGRLAAAVPLLVAFSAGLATVLVALGIGVVYAHRAGGRNFGERRWFRMLPVASALLLLGLGIWFSRDGVQELIALDRTTTAKP